MPAVIAIPQNTYQGAFGPFEIDSIPQGSKGCRLTLARPNGLWPGTSADVVIDVVVEYRYAGVWQQAAAFRGFGGQHGNRFGLPQQSWFCELTWPGHNEGGAIVPDVPEAGRASIFVHVPLPTSGEFRWLS